ncbi:MAG TPA: glycosyltransferase family 87 protein [Gemmatimonadales bacterium]|jgi:hypothetical protein|nr:glycosyltransferase family 87 protein [Gemmatimonadales bacterium]
MVLQKLSRSAVIFLAFALLLIAALTAMYGRRLGDYAGYLTVGQLALAGRDVYRDAPPGINTWPPFFSLFCAPLALLSGWSALGTRIAWLLLNWAALLVVLACAVRMTCDRPLGLPGSASDRGERISVASSAALLPLLFCLRWILANFEHLQINILILALTSIGLLMHRCGRDGRAGVLIGAAAALKVLPVLFVPYFIWRRQWRAALMTATATVAWSLIPAAVWGMPRFVSAFHAWIDVLRAGSGVGKMNLSVYAMIDRTVGHGIVPFTVAGTDTLPFSGSTVSRITMYVALGLVTALACWRFRGAYDRGSRSAVAEWCIVLLVGAIFGPLTWKPYLVVMVPAMVLAVAAWRDTALPARFRRALRALTWVAFLIGMAAANVLVGNRIAELLEMSSVLTVSALVVLGELFWCQSVLNAPRRRSPYSHPGHAPP